jgi:hypothetical protein
MENPQKIPKTFSCEMCNYNTSSLKDYNKHLATNKHINRTQLNNLELKNPNGEFICKKCNKCYKARNSLWYHEQKCNQIVNDNKNEPSDKQLIVMLLKQNSEIIKEHSELIKENSELRKEQADIKELILEIVKNNSTATTSNINTNHSHNTTNSHNKAFNLNFFLNETCKNAMNITDFVESIKLQLSDFMNMGEVGFVENISNIIVKNLNSLDETVRPIHCTDQKRETFYVKDEDKWEKEEDNNKKLKKMIRSIAYKNEKLIKKYKETYPDYNNSESKRSDQYSKIMIEAMDCKDASREKIIRNISKATTIEKK